jgi:hypothetical protein
MGCPKVFVILAGTTNLTTAPNDCDSEEIAQGIKAIVETCQRQSPDAKVVLMSIFPRNDNRAALPLIRQINDRLLKYADGQRVRFLDINNKLADSEGILHQGMTIDDLHLTVCENEVWAADLRPILLE